MAPTASRHPLVAGFVRICLRRLRPFLPPSFPPPSFPPSLPPLAGPSARRGLRGGGTSGPRVPPPPLSECRGSPQRPLAPSAAGERRGRRHGRAGAGALRVGLVSGAELGRAAASASGGDSERRGGVGSAPCLRRAVRGASASPPQLRSEPVGGRQGLVQPPVRSGPGAGSPWRGAAGPSRRPCRESRQPCPGATPEAPRVGGGLPACPGTGLARRPRARP